MISVSVSHDETYVKEKQTYCQAHLSIGYWLYDWEISIPDQRWRPNNPSNLKDLKILWPWTSLSGDRSNQTSSNKRIIAQFRWIEGLSCYHLDTTTTTTTLQ